MSIINREKTMIDSKRFFHYARFLGGFVLFLYIIMKFIKMMNGREFFEMGMPEFIVLGYICLMVPLITALIILPKAIIFIGDVNAKIWDTKKPLEFVYDSIEDKNEEK